jgi:D-alanine transaminase
VAWQDGRIINFADAVVPIEDRGLMFGESVYEVVPVVGARVRLLEPHVARMRRGATALGIEDAIPDDETWHDLTRGLIEREALEEGTLYAQATGGAARRVHVPEQPPRPSFFAYLKTYGFPRPERVLAGLRLVTMPDSRWARCDLKTTMLLPSVLAKREARRQGADEVLLLDADARVREGGSTNLFLVERGGLHTPVLSPHVLPGITRATVMGLAKGAGLPIQEGQIPLSRVLAADEVFVTSTSLLAMPVVSVDGQAIGTGKPGPVTIDLAGRMRAHLGLAHA